MTQHARDDLQIVVVRALTGVGDVLCAVPALRLLRHSLPTARIRYIGIDRAAGLAARFRHYIDDYVPFPGWPGIGEHSDHIDANALSHCRRADLLVQMHGDGTNSNGFCVSLAPERMAAWGPVVSAKMRVSTAPFAPGHNEVARCLTVAERGLRLLGVTPAPASVDLEFPLRIADVAEAASCRARSDLLERAYAVVHPGAASPDRRWPVARFAAVARRLAQRGLVPVVTGSGAESDLVRGVAAQSEADVVTLAGELSLGGMAALISGARGVITNDTGISHLAAAVRAPSVVVFTGSDPRRWAPVDTERHRAIAAATADPPGVPTIADALQALASLGIAN